MSYNKISDLLYIIALATALIACTGDPENQTDNQRTPIGLADITIAGNHTRATHTAWEERDELQVSFDSGQFATYTYSGGQWQHTGGDIFYMEDYRQGYQFDAAYNPSVTDVTDQSTIDKYYGQTKLTGKLTLSGRTLSGQLTHWNADLVVTLKQGQGWEDGRFQNSINSFRYKDLSNNDIIPYQVINNQSVTLRAQLDPSDIPAPGQTLFTIVQDSKTLNGTYTLESGGSRLRSGQRLTLEITYHASGQLDLLTATVTDFENVNDLPPMPGEQPIGGYKYIVNDWETLVYALNNVQDFDAILQTADIICPQDQSKRVVKNFPSAAWFNGGGHTITGLTAPLFNQSSGYLYNIHLCDSKVINATEYDAGLLANYNNSGTITLCSAAGQLQSSAGRTGGLVGYNTGTITRSLSDCEVTGTGDYTGGLVGANWGQIAACAAHGEIVDTGENKTTGTLAGWNDYRIYYSYATAPGKPVGEGDGIRMVPVSIFTIVIDINKPLGLSGESRSFDASIDSWWHPEAYSKIDWKYEGIYNPPT